MVLQGMARTHFEAPRHAGRFDPAAGVVGRGCAGHVQSGIEVEFQVLASTEGRLGAARWLCLGPPEAIAAASWLSDTVAGSTPEGAAGWTAPAICDALALPAQAVSVVLVVEDAFRHALADLERQL
ncbi:iron-sulfur cluster assembly scaffold protein [Aquisalimonas asiatica]|uniref:NifU-like N terminal domain-containing protein n=1 Tax=Aquisalimonas asiatica TaxID=406100 RepID=A0A1H8PMK1_9GAMM|nr:iron-sulfur cluster assembly scaffold protein [Aquisalimonas asiatica]SEO42996.1 NifU-like N terminal domain-containing protein [Aquisalimonas asiatica]